MPFPNPPRAIPEPCSAMIFPLGSCIPTLGTGDTPNVEGLIIASGANANAMDADAEPSAEEYPYAEGDWEGGGSPGTEPGPEAK